MISFNQLRELADKIAKNIEEIDDNFIEVFSQIHRAIYEHLGRGHLLDEEIFEMYNLLMEFDQKDD